MADAPHLVKVSIDLTAAPVDIGGGLMTETLVPVLMHVEQHLVTREGRIQYWTGIMASLAGAMTRAVGTDEALAIIDSIRPLTQLVAIEAGRRAH